jgi:hypothetical protein
MEAVRMCDEAGVTEGCETMCRRAVPEAPLKSAVEDKRE